jgi:hypothetical protein
LARKITVIGRLISKEDSTLSPEGKAINRARVERKASFNLQQDDGYIIRHFN